MGNRSSSTRKQIDQRRQAKLNHKSGITTLFPEKPSNLVKKGQSTNRSKYCPNAEAAKHERRNSTN